MKIIKTNYIKQINKEEFEVELGISISSDDFAGFVTFSPNPLLTSIQIRMRLKENGKTKRLGFYSENFPSPHLFDSNLLDKLFFYSVKEAKRSIQ